MAIVNVSASVSDFQNWQIGNYGHPLLDLIRISGGCLVNDYLRNVSSQNRRAGSSTSLVSSVDERRQASHDSVGLQDS